MENVYEGGIASCFNIGDIVGSVYKGALVGVCQSACTIKYCKYSNELDAIGNTNVGCTLTQTDVTLDPTLTEERIKTLLND